MSKSSLFTDEELADVARRQAEIDGVKARIEPAYRERLAELVGAPAGDVVAFLGGKDAKAIADELRPMLPLARPLLNSIPEPLRTILIGVEKLVERL